MDAVLLLTLVLVTSVDCVTIQHSAKSVAANNEPAPSKDDR